ncbi:hypothetical protein E2C01_047223 [Portunus trituberculatus]|uniref:Uncharacterized protein n=1 Tax=Portunus trituberculatus TaxID=210409 RepID=A0A5B7G9W2_PORTR|nr:hypothetical protein [Portunus trituberculatus]
MVMRKKQKSEEGRVLNPQVLQHTCDGRGQVCAGPDYLRTPMTHTPLFTPSGRPSHPVPCQQPLVPLDSSARP